MKALVSILAAVLEAPETRRNLGVLFKFLGVLLGIIVVYTVVFHVIMVSVEGKDHSWVTGFYWTLTVMSTLGFGDIVFDSDIGRIFSILVLVSGIILLLILLPFTLIPFLLRAVAGSADTGQRATPGTERPDGPRGHLRLRCAGHGSGGAAAPV